MPDNFKTKKEDYTLFCLPLHMVNMHECLLTKFEISKDTN